jgi:two-component system, LuxR family, sensor kinase FixL
MTSKIGDAPLDHAFWSDPLESGVRSAPDGRKMMMIEGVSGPRSHEIAVERAFALPGVAVGVIYLAAYVLLDWVSFIHPFTPLGITPWNPGTGLSFVVILLFGPRMIPYLFLAPMLADLVNLQMQSPWGAALLSAAVIGGGYAAASMFLRRPAAHFDPALPSLRDLALLMVVAVVSAAFVASSYVGVMIAAGLLPITDMAAATFRYWIGDLIGITVFTPFGLIALTRRRVLRASVETALQIGAIIAALALIFGFPQEQQFQLFYVLFLPIVWIAVRAGFEGVCVGILIAQLGLIAGVELSRSDAHDLMAFQALMLILSMTGLVAGELVSQGRRAESQLRLHRESLAQVARLGNLGELAAAVAHEINQPLAAAGTYTRLVNDALHEGGADPAVVAETANKAVVQIERAAEVVRRLRALVRLDRSGRAPCGVERIIKETIALCQPALDRSHIAVRWSVDTELPLVMVDMLQIGQTLLNLMRNSIEAITEAGHVEGLISIEAARREGDRVEIRVADNGPGFPPGFMDNPFLPLASHKAEGLGVGLPLCRSIVESHGGQLWLNRDAGGADVHFTLPVAKD